MDPLCFSGNFLSGAVEPEHGIAGPDEAPGSGKRCHHVAGDDQQLQPWLSMEGHAGTTDPLAAASLDGVSKRLAKGWLFHNCFILWWKHSMCCLEPVCASSWLKGSIFAVWIHPTNHTLTVQVLAEEVWLCYPSKWLLYRHQWHQHVYIDPKLSPMLPVGQKTILLKRGNCWLWPHSNHGNAVEPKMVMFGRPGVKCLMIDNQSW